MFSFFFFCFFYLDSALLFICIIFFWVWEFGIPNSRVPNSVTNLNFGLSYPPVWIRVSLIIGYMFEKYPANIYLFEVNYKNTRKRCKICSKLTIKTPERRQWRRSDVFIVNFEHISHLFLVFLLLLWTSEC